ncbi:MAG: hypothetical protein ABWY65_09225 [Thermoleophilaceae bacterium]
MVTPHAAFLALRYAPRATLANLEGWCRTSPASTGKWGFRDSALRSARTSDPRRWSRALVAHRSGSARPAARPS